jgi:hypothetical protein
MSINCVNKCAHQKDGYCSLSELPSATQAMTTPLSDAAPEVMDCPYFKSVE